jgi:hypothetical protein
MGKRCLAPDGPEKLSRYSKDKICQYFARAGFTPEDVPIEAAPSEADCSSCLRHVGLLEEERGDPLCQQCRAAFHAARVLIRKGIEDEFVIMPTLAFAEGVRFVEQKPVEGVLLLRQEPATVEVERYEGSMLPKRICIRVF